jgi:hypothetical protein
MVTHLERPIGIKSKTKYMFIPKNDKDIKGLRDFLTQQRTQACSVSAAFTGPMKQLFDEMTAKIDGWLSQLPKDEVPGDWSLGCQLDQVFALMAQLSAAASLAALEVTKLNTGEQFATACTAEINKRVTAGELFTKDGLAAHVKSLTDGGELVGKDSVKQLCAAAQQVGFAEGDKKVRDEMAAQIESGKVIGARKTSLQAASLPLPDAEIEAIVLGGTDEEFNKRKATFETRLAALKAENIQLNADSDALLLANLWADDKAYAGFEKTVRNIPQLKLKGNPLARVPGGPATGEKTLHFVV